MNHTSIISILVRCPFSERTVIDGGCNMHTIITLGLPKLGNVQIPDDAFLGSPAPPHSDAFFQLVNIA